MAIANHHSAYSRLTDRLNRFPQGAPPSELLFAILKMLFNEKEADLVAHRPIRPFTAAQAARAWKMKAAAAEAISESLAERAILVDIPEIGVRYYCLPPSMAGFFEFSLMRVRDEVDQKALNELCYQDINLEEDFIIALFLDGQMPLGRIFVQEAALSEANALQVLDYERASAVIQSAAHIAISPCYCRHQMAHVRRDCGAPNECCMTFNTTAASLIKYGHARRVEAPECIDLLEQTHACNLVQFGENVQPRVNFICNCCGAAQPPGARRGHWGDSALAADPTLTGNRVT